MLDERLGLAGRVVIVAGAGGGGIGTAVCRLVAEAGAWVAAVDIDPERLAVTEQALAGRTHSAIVADVRVQDEVDQAVAEAARLGPLHGLVHVAGGLRPEQWAPLLDTSTATFDDVVRLNLHAARLTSTATARHLVECGTSGSIVHIASIAALSAMPFGAAYSAAKAGLLALTRTAAVEWARHGIRVNAVAPGTVRTPRNAATSPEDTDTDRAAIPLRRRGVPDDVAGPVVFLLSDLAGFVTGQVLAVDGGSSVKPSYLDDDDFPVFVRDEALRSRLRQI